MSHATALTDETIEDFIEGQDKPVLVCFYSSEGRHAVPVRPRDRGTGRHPGQGGHRQDRRMEAPGTGALLQRQVVPHVHHVRRRPDQGLLRWRRLRRPSNDPLRGLLLDELPLRQQVEGCRELLQAARSGCRGRSRCARSDRWPPAFPRGQRLRRNWRRTAGRLRRSACSPSDRRSGT